MRSDTTRLPLVLTALVGGLALFEAKDAYFRWLPSDLADIPVPHPTKELRRRFEVLVDLAAGSPEAIDAESNDLVFRLYGVEGVERSEIELWYGKRLQAETVRSALAFAEETPVHGTAPEDRLEET